MEACFFPELLLSDNTVYVITVAEAMEARFLQLDMDLLLLLRLLPAAPLFIKRCPFFARSTRLAPHTVDVSNSSLVNVTTLKKAGSGEGQMAEDALAPADYKEPRPFPPPQSSGCH